MLGAWQVVSSCSCSWNSSSAVSGVCWALLRSQGTEGDACMCCTTQLGFFQWAKQHLHWAFLYFISISHLDFHFCCDAVNVCESHNNYLWQLRSRKRWLLFPEQKGETSQFCLILTCGS